VRETKSVVGGDVFFRRGALQKMISAAKKRQPVAHNLGRERVGRVPILDEFEQR